MWVSGSDMRCIMQPDRLETPAAQTLSPTTGGFPALCHKPGKDDQSLRSEDKQHCDKSSKCDTQSFGRLIWAEPVFAVLNVTLPSSALMENCLTTHSYSANKGLFYRTKTPFCSSAWLGLFMWGSSSILGCKKLFRQHDGRCDTFRIRQSAEECCQFELSGSWGCEAAADWQLCVETLRKTYWRSHHTHSQCFTHTTWYFSSCGCLLTICQTKCVRALDSEGFFGKWGHFIKGVFES